MGAVLLCQEDGLRDNINGAPPRTIEDLHDHGLLDTPRDSDADAVHVSTEDRPGAMGAVTICVIDPLFREVLRDDLDALECRMVPIDSGIDYCDDDPGSVEVSA